MTHDNASQNASQNQFDNPLNSDKNSTSQSKNPFVDDTQKREPESALNQPQEETVDDIMASIMATISKEVPSPVDGKHEAVIHQPSPLDYDVYQYDDKPAVILGAGMSATSGMGQRKPTFEGEPVSSDTVDHEAQKFEQARAESAHNHAFNADKNVDQSLTSISEPQIGTQFDQQTESQPEYTAEFTKIKPTNLQPEHTSVMPVVQSIPPAPVMPQSQVDPSKSVPFIPLKDTEDPNDKYKVEFDFGDRNPSKLITVFPFLLHVLIGIGVAGYIYYRFAMNAQPVSPLGSDLFNYTLYALAALVVLGIILGLLVGLIARAKAYNKSGWIASGFARSGFSTLICVILWGVAMFLADAVATGKIAL